MRVVPVVAAAVASLAVSAPSRAHADEARATVYVFFATWCVPCRVELPHVQRMHDRYKQRGVRVVLVSEDEPSTVKTVPSFLARYNVSVPWIADNESELLERYNPSANVPFSVVLDAKGGVVYAHAGYEPGDERLIEAAAMKALARTATTTATGAKQGVRVNGSTQGLGVWRTSRFDDNAADGKLRAAAGRVEVSGYADSYHAIARVDGTALDRTGNAEDARVERFRLGANLGRLRMQLGDDYVQFGHGVSLSLRKVDPLGLDTSLRGARVDLTLPRTQVKLLAGWTNPQNLDPIELTVVDDANDLITGGEVKVDVTDSLSLAPYGLFIRAEGAADDGSDVDWALGGLASSLTVGSLNLAGEFAAGTRKGMLLTDETTWAAYLSAQWQMNNVTALIDAKAYRRWEIGRGGRSLLYHEPPSLERPDQEVAGTSDAIGARARVEVTLGRTVVFANALGYRFGQSGMAPLDGDLAMHGYLGVERRFANNGSTSLQVGLRDENRADGSDRLSLWHVDVDFAWPLAKNWAATFKWNHRSETKNLVFSELAFVRGLGVAGLAWTGVGTLSMLYGYSTEDATTPTHYPAAEMLVRLPRSSFARLFVGRLTGGRVCVSGSCRDVPPFSGARLDLVMRFR